MTLTITLIIIIVTVAVSLYASEKLDFRHKLLFNPYRVVHSNEYYRVFSHAFIHADLFHLGVNMFVLYFFGDNVESLFNYQYGAMGQIYFILLYIGGIIFATLPALRKHKDNPHYNSLGASGAVSAVLFAAIVMQPTQTLLVYAIIPVPAVIFGIAYIGYEMYQNKNGRTNIAHDAHLLGAVYGIIFTIMLSPSEVISNFINQIVSKF